MTAEAVLIAGYLDYLERMCAYSPLTLRKHQRICRWWIGFLHDRRGQSLSTATPDDLLAWIVERQASGTVRNSTIAAELCVFRTLYGFLFTYGRMGRNPAAALPELICAPPAETVYLTVDECFRLLDVFDTADPLGRRNYVLVALLWSTGLRTAELCALDWADLDLERATLLVRRGKGGKQRQLFLNDRLREDLRQYRQKLGAPASGPVFRAFSVNAPDGARHQRLSQRQAVSVLRESAPKAGIAKRVTPMTLRHTFATHMYEAGVTLEEIREMLGHDNETETTVYVHITLEAAKRFLNNHVANPCQY